MISPKKNKDNIVRLGLVWFGLVSLFNGISTFVVYLTPKPSVKKNSSDAI